MERKEPPIWDSSSGSPPGPFGREVLWGENPRPGRGDKVSVSYYAACYGVEGVAKPRRAECFRLQEALQGWTAKSGGKTRS